MFGRFMPTEGRFFELFNLHAHEIVEGGKELVALMNVFSFIMKTLICLIELRPQVGRFISCQVSRLSIKAAGHLIKSKRSDYFTR